MTQQILASCISYQCALQDAASEKLRTCRQRIKALTAKLASVLKGYGGEVSDKGGRMCVALPAGETGASCSLPKLYSAGKLHT